jgi:hypothetical protein
METENFSPAPQKEKERKRKENLVFTRISPPANTWDTLHYKLMEAISIDRNVWTSAIDFIDRSLK